MKKTLLEGAIFNSFLVYDFGGGGKQSRFKIS